MPDSTSTSPAPTTTSSDDSDVVPVRMSAEADPGGEDPVGVTEEQQQQRQQQKQQQQQRGDDGGFSLLRGVEMARRRRWGWASFFSFKTRGEDRRAYDALPADTDGGHSDSPAEEEALPLGRDVAEDGTGHIFEQAAALEIEGGGFAISDIRGNRRSMCRAFACVAPLVFAVAAAVVAAKVRTITSMPPDPPASTDCPAVDDGANALGPRGLRDLDLNREAAALSPAERERLRLGAAHLAFAWNDGDGRTRKWRPQGITTFTLPAVSGQDGDDVNAGEGMGKKKFVLVSWYGRRDAGYLNRGGRVTFVDVSEAAAAPDATNATADDAAGVFRYRHVLLVDSNFRSFPGLHVGGLSHDPVAGKLLVPDSRPFVGHKIRLFDLSGTGGGGVSGMFRVPECRREHFFDYAYVWRESGYHDVSILPSFLEYDPDRGGHVVGTFSHCSEVGSAHSDSRECRSGARNRLLWLTEGGGGADDDESGDDASSGSAAAAARETAPCYPFFSDMQGAASARVSQHPGDGDDGDRRGVLWVSSSYGAAEDSHLHAAYFDPDADCRVDGGGRGPVVEEYRTVRYPPGLEDLHLEEAEEDADVSTKYNDGTNVGGGGGRNMWMLTEYIPRLVFATRVEDLLP